MSLAAANIVAHPKTRNTSPRSPFYFRLLLQRNSISKLACVFISPKVNMNPPPCLCQPIHFTCSPDTCHHVASTYAASLGISSPLNGVEVRVPRFELDQSVRAGCSTCAIILRSVDDNPEHVDSYWGGDHEQVRIHRSESSLRVEIVRTMRSFEIYRDAENGGMLDCLTSWLTHAVPIRDLI